MKDQDPLPAGQLERGRVLGRCEAESEAQFKLDEIQRRCQLRIDMVRAQNPDNEYNPNTRPAWILVSDVLNVITPSRKYSQE